MSPEEESATRGDWQEWAISRLDDDELGHCGHLDTRMIDVSCRFCQEIVAHVNTHSMAAPHILCEQCEWWRQDQRAIEESSIGDIGGALGSWWLIEGACWQIVGQDGYTNQYSYRRPPLKLKLRNTVNELRVMTDWRLKNLADTGRASLTRSRP